MKRQVNVELIWERLSKARSILTGVTIGSGASLILFSLWLRMSFTPIWLLLIVIFLATTISVMVLNRFVD